MQLTPDHRLFSLLPSGRRYRALKTHASRLKNSFLPQSHHWTEHHKTLSPFFHPPSFTLPKNLVFHLFTIIVSLYGNDYACMSVCMFNEPSYELHRLLCHATMCKDHKGILPRCILFSSSPGSCNILWFSYTLWLKPWFTCWNRPLTTWTFSSSSLLNVWEVSRFGTALNCQLLSATIFC